MDALTWRPPFWGVPVRSQEAGRRSEPAAILACDSELYPAVLGFGESQVLGEGVNRCETLIVNRGSAAIADASRIHQRGTENVGLFQGGDLAIGLRSYQHRIEFL